MQYVMTAILLASLGTFTFSFGMAMDGWSYTAPLIGNKAAMRQPGHPMVAKYRARFKRYAPIALISMIAIVVILAGQLVSDYTLLIPMEM